MLVLMRLLATLAVLLLGSLVPLMAQENASAEQATRSMRVAKLTAMRHVGTLGTVRRVRAGSANETSDRKATKKGSQPAFRHVHVRR